MSAPVPLERPATAGWDFPRSVAGIALLVDLASGQGLPASAVLRGTGVTPDRLGEAAGLVPATAELAALANVAAVLTPGHGGSLGLVLGRAFHATSFGALGFALLTSRSLLDAVNLALRFLDLSHIVSSPTATVEGSDLVARFEVRELPPGTPPSLGPVLVERDVAAVHQVLEELLDEPVVPTGLTFPHPAPGPEAVPAWRRATGAGPSYGDSAAMLRLPASLLGKALPRSNPHSQVLAEQLCGDLVSQRRAARGSGAGTAAEVAVWVAAHLTQQPTMTHAARAMAMSERTLRRRLAESGTTFQAVLDEVRERLARQMLATGVLTVDDVAQRLGYAEASSFIHAFKRWTGGTPAAYRRLPGRG